MPPLPVIVPSWVIPGSPAANAAFLRGRVRGVMLCCFEYAPRLPMELPPSRFGLQWHIHLPVDLPWDQSGEAAGAAACRAMASAAHLLDAPSRAVLHRPPRSSLLADFLRVWRQAGYADQALLLENLPDDNADQPDLPSIPSGPSLCLDAAHLALACPPASAMRRVTALASRVAMIHWSAPRGGKDAHAPLSALDADRKKLYRHIAESNPSALDVIEVFDWDGVLASWNLLRDWRGAAGGEPCLG